MSVREDLLAAFYTLLNAGGKPVGLTVERGRFRTVEPSSLPFQAIHADLEILDEGTHDLDISRAFRFTVVSRVKATTGSADAALDPYLSWAEQAILADPGVGGDAIRVRLLRIDWDKAEDLTEPYGGASQTFEVVYETEEADPESA